MLDARIAFRDDQVFLDLEGRWTILSARPLGLPRAEDELPLDAIEDQLARLWRIRELEIVGVELPDEAPHLLLTLSDGRVVLAWGGPCDHLEPWSLESEDREFILRSQGLGVSLFAPDDFAPPVG